MCVLFDAYQYIINNHKELLPGSNDGGLEYDVFTNISRENWKDIRSSSELSIVISRRTKKEIENKVPREKIERSIRQIVKGMSSSKSDFMYSLIVARKQYEVMPKYIKEGLKWLAQK